MRPLINELNEAGIPDEDISIVFAQGTHRAQTPDEDIAVVGEEVARRIRLYQHDCHDRENLVLVGTTSHGTPVELNRRVVEADFVIVPEGSCLTCLQALAADENDPSRRCQLGNNPEKPRSRPFRLPRGEGINPLTEAGP